VNKETFEEGRLLVGAWKNKQAAVTNNKIRREKCDKKIICFLDGNF
jgi:hypothetical protein